MKRHTKRIVAVALLALAGGAFCVDRFVLGYSGPQAAAAATQAADAPKAVAAPTPGVESPQELSVTKRVGALKDRLPEWGVEAERDALSVPAAWHVDPPLAEKAVTAETVAAAKPIEVPKFLLSSVIGGKNGEHAMAIINGRALKVDDTIEGYLVVSIGTTKPDLSANVVLSGEAGEIVVRPVAMENQQQGSKPELSKAAGAAR